MKTILVPTDYSATANNALSYAMELAKINKAKIILFHAYHIPIPTTDMPVFLLSPQELEKENKAKMKKLQNQLTRKYGTKIKTETVINSGFAPDEILDIIKKKKADTVVMGIKGSGKLTEALIGSTTVSVMKKADCPLIIVPDKAKFKQIKKIIFACDYEQMKDYSVLKPLRELAETNNAEILIFNVNDSRVHPVAKDAYFDACFKNVKHTFWFSDNNNIVEAINEFAKKNNGALIAMVGHKYSFPENIFHKSRTKDIAFHSKTPIFSLHE